MVKWKRIVVSFGLSTCTVVALTALHFPCSGNDLVPNGIVLMIGTANAKSSDSMQSIVEAVEAQIADLGVKLEVMPPTDIPPDAAGRLAAATRYLKEPGISAVFWCIPEAARYRAFVYFPAADAEATPTVRDVEVAGAEGTGETVAVILRASIIALRHSREAPAPTMTVPPPDRPPPFSGPVQPADSAPAYDSDIPSEPPVKTTELLTVEGAYRAAIPSANWQPIHAAFLSAGLQIFDFVRLHLSYVVTAPYHTADEDLTLTVRHHPIGFGVLLFFRHKILEARFRLSFFVDYTTTNFSLNNNALTANTVSGQVEISMLPNLEAAVTLVGHLRIFFGLGMNLFLTRPKYTVQLSDGPETVFAPWAVQPMGTVGLSIGFF